VENTFFFQNCVIKGNGDKFLTLDNVGTRQDEKVKIFMLGFISSISKRASKNIENQ
jgi:hypothetical protein